MNSNLYNKSILIGKDPSNGKLLVSLLMGGVPKMAAIGEAGSVPNYVSRCVPAEGKAHCCIDIDGDGKMTVTNMKEQNVTYVNGLDVEQKYITMSDRIELGGGRYPLDLEAVLAMASKVVTKVEKMAPPPPPKEYSIDHLKEVQDEYQKGNEKIEHMQTMNGVLMAVPAMVSGLGTVTVFIAQNNGLTGLRNITIAGTVVALMATLYRVYKNIKAPASKLKRENADRYKKNYVCPHKECGRTLKSYDFDELLKIKKCPYCGSKFKSTI